MAEIPNENQAQIIKSKRTKRQRFDPCANNSPSSSADNCCSSSAGVLTEEEEDQYLANCLILLAREKTNKLVANNNNHNSLFVYRCKTCDRCFNSFQALGGHRASHKKPKINNNFTNSILNSAIHLRPPPPLAAGIHVIKPPKVHDCSVCGAAFSSGQALGRHMRRHRPLKATTTRRGITTTTPQLKEYLMIKKERNVLGLDLNLPAPEAVAVAVFSAASPFMNSDLF